MYQVVASVVPKWEPESSLIRVDLICSTPPTTTSIWSFGSLGEDISQFWIVFIFVYVMDSHVSLQIIWSGIFMLPIRAERTYVTRRVVYQSVPNHFVLSLESLSSFTSSAAFDRAVVRTTG